MPGSVEHCAGGGGVEHCTGCVEHCAGVGGRGALCRRVLVVSEDVINRDRKHPFIVKEIPLFT